MAQAFLGYLNWVRSGRTRKEEIAYFDPCLLKSGTGT